MKNLLSFVLSCSLAAISACASAGVAPAAPNSALIQSGAKIAAPAKQFGQGQDRQEHQETPPKDPTK
jgi:hypothetical protein